MRKLIKVSLMIMGVVSLMLLTNRLGPAQKLPKHIYVQARATVFEVVGPGLISELFSDSVF